jgi:signal transduction histidine kinase
VELPALLKEASEAFSSSDHAQAATARVDIEIGGDVPAVMADRTQMHAVILELIMNAATAAQGAGTVRVTAELDEVYNAVVLAVQDDGPGMDDKTLRRVFTPFFSSQEAGRRRGLGLPRAKRYVENNGGRIWIKSKPGEGTTVYVQLPRV